MMTANRSTFLCRSAAALAAASLGTLPAASFAAPLPDGVRRSIVQVRVYEVDPDLETALAMAPGTFLGFPDLRQRVHRDRATIDAFLEAIASTKPRDARGGIDTRYGLRFSSRHGIVAEAFIDRFFATAVVNGVPVEPQTPELLRAAFDRAIS